MELLGSQYQYSNLLLCVLMALHSLPYYPNSVVFTPGLVRHIYECEPRHMAVERRLFSYKDYGSVTRLAFIVSI